FKDTPSGDPQRDLLDEVTATLALSAALGRSSALYQELYEADLIDDTFSARFVGGGHFAHTIIAGETKDPEELHRRLLDGLERLRKRGIPAEDIRRTQRQAGGEFVQLFDSLEFIANRSLYFHFKGVSLFDYMRAPSEATPDQVTARPAEHLPPERPARAIVWPQGRRCRRPAGRGRAVRRGRGVGMAGTPRNVYGFIALGVAAVSTAAIFVKLSTAPPVLVAFYRIFLAWLALAPLIVAKER